MIPLKTTEPVKTFPWKSVGVLGLWVGADLLSRFWPGDRSAFLSSVAFVPEHPSWTWLSSGFFHANFFSLMVSVFFAWTFTPTLWERRSALFLTFAGLSSLVLALLSYAKLHPHSTAPILAPQAILGGWLGVFMRRDIWGSVDTWVVGPRLNRILEVPSYVLLFFWFFYLLIGNLLTNPPFSDAPLLYWIPFISFLWGFVLETVWEILSQWTLSSLNRRKSVRNRS